ncbi:GIY-YIG nuclease family protein [uncultured Anaerococcus sp.]|uniref:GIY-YIG nuclease family protein n=1 Tax=uncultured Anaerococcus sp. TaxID=293428 RepID=UPI00288BEA66|nr:GIY-YIG nuclease family protein [uncultured Anaerococcus sp.]
MNFVYILRCGDNSLYTGYTNDVKARLKTHNLGKGAKYTRSRLPVKLVYYKRVDSKSRALKLEARIKKLTKKEKEALVKAFNLEK